MKHLYLILALTLITASSFSQAFYVSTAKKNGNFSDFNVWNYTERVDGKKVTTVIIPKNIKIVLDVNYSMVSMGDVEMEIEGILELKSDKGLTLNSNSTISIKGAGEITINAAAQNDKKNKNSKKNETIMIGNKVKFDGKIDGSMSGNVYASSSTGVSPLGFSTNAMLPVNFVAFNASKSNENNIALDWTTTDEVNNSHFEIQRSTDGINFKTIAFVLPDTNNSNVHLYKYNDRFSAEGVVYYRIRQVDFDGKDKYTAIKVIGGKKSETAAQIFVSGKNTVTVDLSNMNGNTVVRIISMNGVIVNQKNNISEDRISITTYNATPGAYVVQVSDNKGLFTSKKVLL